MEESFWSGMEGGKQDLTGYCSGFASGWGSTGMSGGGDGRATGMGSFEFEGG